MPRTTQLPGHPVVLFDGDCVFCRRSTDRLRRIVADDGVEYVSFRTEGVLDRFPGITEDECDRGMQMVTAKGRIFSGAEAAARVLLLRAWLFPAWLYYVPGIRSLVDAVYRQIAIRRFGINGRSSSCSNEVCVLAPPPTPEA